MARRPRLFAPGVLYHVIVRGNQRQKTFTSASDYQAYLERLAKYRKQYGYTVYAFCLMSNHVHLLVHSSATPLAKFMQGLQQSYTQYFNRRHKKSGHLFEGRYKAIVCQEDPYLLELIRYIHLNPLRAGLAKTMEKLDDYPWKLNRKIMPQNQRRNDNGTDQNNGPVQVHGFSTPFSVMPEVLSRASTLPENLDSRLPPRE